MRSAAKVLGTAFALLAFMGASGAQAAQIHLHASAFDGSTTPAGSFAGPERMAIDQSADLLYLLDAANGQLLKFDLSGSTPAPANFSALSSPAINGQGGGDPLGDEDATGDNQLGLNTEADLAVDNSGGASDGNIYVVSEALGKLYAFAPSGEFLYELNGSNVPSTGSLNTPCGVAVGTDGSIYVAGYNANQETGGAMVRKFTPAPGGADFVSETAIGAGTCHIAIDSEDHLYASHYNGDLEKFDLAGNSLGVIDPGYSPALAVNPANDHLFANRGDHVVEYGPDGTQLDSFGAAELSGSISAGIAVRAGANEVYASDFLNHQVQVYEAATAPDVITAAASNLQQTSATLNGSVDPLGIAVSECSFEYGLDTSYGQSIPCSPDPGAGTGPVAVSAEISGLIPGNDYHYRLRAANANGELLGADQTLYTPSPPLVQPVGAGSITDTGATLAARVQPKRAETTYHFEYSTDQGFASGVQETPETGAGGGDAFALLTEAVSGLQPTTTYYFRLVATNATGTTTGPIRSFITRPTATGPGADSCPNAAIRAQQHSAYLPECRAYEMVSPLEKGADVEIGGISRAAEQGGAVAYMSLGNLAPATSRGFLNEFRAARTASGWTTISMNPPLDPYPALAQPQVFQAVSSDAQFGIGLSWGSEEFGHPQAFNLWRYRVSDGGFDLLSQPAGVTLPPESPNGEAVTSGSSFEGVSNDFSHIVFGSSRRLIPEAPVEAEGFPLDAKVDGAYLYEWANGQLQLVNLRPVAEGGEIVLGATLGYGSPTLVPLFYPGQYAVSADGSRIFFADASSPGIPSRQLYVSNEAPGGRVSTQVSASERTDCAGDPTCGGDGEADPAPDLEAPKASSFQLADSDAGGVALFTSPQKLTDQATASNSPGPDVGGGDYCAFVRCSLYLWDPAQPDGSRLVDLTAGAANGGGVQTAVGASDDASRVFFVASGDLAPGAVGGQPNLYLWQRGEGIRFIAALVTDDRGMWVRGIQVGDQTGDSSFGGSVRTTPDGRFILFRSRAQLTAYDTAGHAQLYRYDSVADSLTCVSCNPRATSSTADAFLKRDGGTIIRPPWTSRNISSDGSRVFFDSAEPLVPQDTNGVIDVYEWSADGQIHLLSSGQSPENSAFLDASADGTDAFFTTRSKLVGADIDNLRDLYDARVGGGFVEQQQVPPCLGDSCQGLPPSPAPAQSPSSKSASGPGNVQSAQKPRCRKGKVKRRGKCVSKKRKASKGKAGDNRRAGR